MKSCCRRLPTDCNICALDKQPKKDTIEKNRPKKNKNKQMEILKQYPMYYVFGEGIIKKMSN